MPSTLTSTTKSRTEDHSQFLVISSQWEEKRLSLLLLRELNNKTKQRIRETGRSKTEHADKCKTGLLRAFGSLAQSERKGHSYGLPKARAEVPSRSESG